MKKSLIMILFVLNFTLLSGCTTYNSIVPSWMEINAAENTNVNTASTSNNWKWWNPVSWF